MRKIETMMWSLALGLLLSSLNGCFPPCAPACGPDQQEAGLEKSIEEQPGAGGPPQAMRDTQTRPIIDTHAIIDAYQRCFDGCADQPAGDRPTCHDNCAVEVSAGTGNPAKSACPRSCTKAFGNCLVPCAGETVETCRQECQSLAKDCVDGCN